MSRSTQKSSKVRARQMPGHKRTKRENDIRKHFAKAQKAGDVTAILHEARKTLWQGKEEEALALFAEAAKVAERVARHFEAASAIA